VSEDDDRSRPRSKTAEAMPDELDAVGRPEPQLVSANAIVGGALAARDRRAGGRDRERGEEERQCDPHRLR
jgi:hypothetical protein